MILEKLVIPIGFDTGLLMAGIDAITGLINGAVDRTREWTEGMDALGDVTGLSEDNLAALSFVAKNAEVGGISVVLKVPRRFLQSLSGDLVAFLNPPVRMRCLVSQGGCCREEGV